MVERRPWVSRRQITTLETMEVSENTGDENREVLIALGRFCHFPQISGISSSANELDTYPHSKYIWPIIPQISGLTVLITINIWGSHTVFPIYGIGHLLHVACVIIMYRATGLVG
jgi:hypothetical protein